MISRQFLIPITRLFSLFLLLNLYSCKTDSDKIKNANETVEIFVRDLEMKNTALLNKTYPKFKEIGEYWVLSSFKIDDTKIDGNQITVYGKYKKGNQVQTPIMFILKEFGSEYRITDSKGLSTYYETEIYNFLLNLGCIDNNSGDIEIEKECSKREYLYNSTVEALKSELESLISIDNSNLSSNNGYYVSGNLIVTNNSDFTIPSAAYRMSIGFINTNSSKGVDKQVISDFYPNIPSHESVSIPVTYVPINGGNKFGGIFEIHNSDQLKKVLNEQVSLLKWDCSGFDNLGGF